MNIYPESKDSLSLNLFVGGNSPDARTIGGTTLGKRSVPQARLEESFAIASRLDVSAVARVRAPAALSVIASAPLPHLRWRVVQQDTELEGVQLPAGSLVMVRFDSANRDPALFKHGEEFDLCRKNAGDHLSFGHGIHFCVGAMLARTEMQVAYERLLLRLDQIRLAPGKNDLQHFPNILLRGLKHLYIEFDKAV